MWASSAFCFRIDPKLSLPMQPKNVPTLCGSWIIHWGRWAKRRSVTHCRYGVTEVSRCVNTDLSDLDGVLCGSSGVVLDFELLHQLVKSEIVRWTQMNAGRLSGQCKVCSLFQTFVLWWFIFKTLNIPLKKSKISLDLLTICLLRGEKKQKNSVMPQRATKILGSASWQERNRQKTTDMDICKFLILIASKSFKPLAKSDVTILKHEQVRNNTIVPFLQHTYLRNASASSDSFYPFIPVM